MKLRLYYKMKTYGGSPMGGPTWDKKPTPQYLEEQVTADPLALHQDKVSYEWVDVEEVYEELPKTPTPMKG